MAAHQILNAGQYFGEIRAPLQLNGITLTELKHRRKKALPPHTHRNAYFSMLLEGSYREVFGARTLEYHAGTTALHPENFTHHDFIGGRGGHFFMAELSPEWMQRTQALLPSFTVPAAFLSGDARRHFQRLHAEYRRSDEWSALAIEGLILETLAAMCRIRSTRETAAPHWIIAVCELLHETPAEHISIPSLAERFALEPIYLGRTFKRFTGETLARYRNRLRIEKARHLLQKEIPLVEIAQELGFADQSHLTRVFRREMGTTPAEYRRRLN
jgi:AraC family transcriptional regulator